ncbi:amp-activated protein kinase [Cyclospora cayetanensis]|uniref:Amp-activated protein kinase n=1 Tax=Cyclospora cayetanensis TaxID=88456 RepID=A0A1D3D012_9EIME|nr:amp-activated protein kinase [Cyclospora cayetanensis]
MLLHRAQAAAQHQDHRQRAAPTPEGAADRRITAATRSSTRLRGSLPVQLSRLCSCSGADQEAAASGGTDRLHDGSNAGTVHHGGPADAAASASADTGGGSRDRDRERLLEYLSTSQVADMAPSCCKHIVLESRLHVHTALTALAQFGADVAGAERTCLQSKDFDTTPPWALSLEAFRNMCGASVDTVQRVLPSCDCATALLQLLESGAPYLCVINEGRRAPLALISTHGFLVHLVAEVQGNHPILATNVLRAGGRRVCGGVGGLELRDRVTLFPSNLHTYTHTTGRQLLQ